MWLHLRGEPYTHLPFKTPVFYKYVRHPLYVGWFFAFWATPAMTVAHLVFAVMTAAYIIIAIPFEERDLLDVHGVALPAGGGAGLHDGHRPVTGVSSACHDGSLVC